MSKQAKNFVRPAAEGADLFDEAKMEAQTAKLKKLLPARKAEQEPISWNFFSSSLQSKLVCLTLKSIFLASLIIVV